LYEDDVFFIIRDINPLAKIHYLAIPKLHYSGLADMNDANAVAVGHIFKTIGGLEKTLGIDKGYQLQVNQHEGGGQTVFHLHIHIMAT